MPLRAAVIVSDDSDLAEPIRVVRCDFHRHVTVLSPRGHSRARSLALVATRFYSIEEEALKVSQFPDSLTDVNGRSITKPKRAFRNCLVEVSWARLVPR